MMKPDLQKELRGLHESLTRIKALLAWEWLKRLESHSRRPCIFQIYDSTAEELKSEYTFFVAGLLNLYSVLNDRSLDIPEAMRKAIGRQLTEIEWQVYLLRLNRRFGGPAG